MENLFISSFCVVCRRDVSILQNDIFCNKAKVQLNLTGINVEMSIQWVKVCLDSITMLAPGGRCYNYTI